MPLGLFVLSAMEDRVNIKKIDLFHAIYSEKNVTSLFKKKQPITAHTVSGLCKEMYKIMYYKIP